MAIKSDIGISLMTRITRGDAISGSLGSLYLGLLTTLPTDASANDYVEVPREYTINAGQENEETKNTGYSRFQFSSYTPGQGSSTGSYYYTNGSHNRRHSNGAEWDDNEEAVVFKNDNDDIMMSNISETYSGSDIKVKGFGIFKKNASGTAGDGLVAYGQLVKTIQVDGQDKLVQDEVTLSAGSVPIFYTGNLKFILKDNPVEQQTQQVNN